MTIKRLPYSYFAKVNLIRADASAQQVVEWSDVQLATDADEVKDIAIIHFADKILPLFPGYKVGGKFEIVSHVASDAGWNH
jgi:hypothetical protein